VVGIFPLIEDSAVNEGMKGFHPPVEHFRKPGEFGNIGHGDTALPHFRGGAPRGKDLHAKFDQGPGKSLYARFVGQTDQCPLNFPHFFLLRTAS
jgi:hypothetical protein